MSQYEFTEEQNSTIRSLSRHMTGVGSFAALLGVLVIAGAGFLAYRVWDKLPKIARDIQNSNAELSDLALDMDIVLKVGLGSVGLFGLCFLIVGSSTRNSAASFKKIADTKGQDIPHLMNALSSLNRLYALLFMVIAAILALLIAIQVYPMLRTLEVL